MRYISQILAGLKREHGGERVPTLFLRRVAGYGWRVLRIAVAMRWGSTGPWILLKHAGGLDIKLRLQGNLDPAVLFASPEVIAAEVEKILAGYGNGHGHVFNLGHGISQFTPPENALTLVEAVHVSAENITSTSFYKYKKALNTDKTIRMC